MFRDVILKRLGKLLPLSGWAVYVIMSHVLFGCLLLGIAWNPSDGGRDSVRESVSESVREQTQEQNPVQESAQVQTASSGRPWHWRKVWGGTFLEPEPLEEGQGGRRAADSYLGIPNRFMESGAEKYQKYLKQYVYAGTVPQQDTDRDSGREWPKTLLHFWGTDRVKHYFGAKAARDFKTKTYSSTAFMNDLFYIEIPQDFNIGTNAAAPLIFYHQSEEKKRPKEKMITFECGVPEELLGESEKIDEYVLAGGLEEILESALGQELTEEYHLEKISSGSFVLSKNKEDLADVIVWPEIGQVVVRDQRNRILFERKDDYGRILLRQEWQDVDFSSAEAIVRYMEDGGAERLTDTMLGESGSWSGGTRYQTKFHEFLRFEGEFEGRQVTLYIPITAAEQSKWILLFETFEGSEVEDNAYAIQERVIGTFTLFPYYHVVRSGDTLAAISRSYTGHTDSYEEIAAYPTNGIADPDKIYPGQKIEIPLGLRYQSYMVGEG